MPIPPILDAPRGEPEPALPAVPVNEPPAGVVITLMRPGRDRARYAIVLHRRAPGERR